MSNKLTKNDSMSIEKHRLEIAVAAFKALLTRRGLYESYFHAWNCEGWRSVDIPADMAWENWAKQTESEEWVSEAFVWASSAIPTSVWQALDIDWWEYCTNNLKK